MFPPRTSVGAVLRAQGSLYPEKNRVKMSAQSELWISRNIRNSFRPDQKNVNRSEVRGRSNLGRAPAPPPPRRPWNRGGTLLPSRGEAKEEEGGGCLSPSLPGASQRRRGNHRVTAIYSKNSVIFTNNSITFPHLYSVAHSPATRYILYLNMVLYVTCYYPMICCHPMMLE